MSAEDFDQSSDVVEEINIESDDDAPENVDESDAGNGESDAENVESDSEDVESDAENVESDAENVESEVEEIDVDSSDEGDERFESFGSPADVDNRNNQVCLYYETILSGRVTHCKDTC